MVKYMGNIPVPNPSLLFWWWIFPKQNPETPRPWPHWEEGIGPAARRHAVDHGGPVAQKPWIGHLLHLFYTLLAWPHVILLCKQFFHLARLAPLQSPPSLHQLSQFKDFGKRPCQAGGHNSLDITWCRNLETCQPCHNISPLALGCLQIIKDSESGHLYLEATFAREASSVRIYIGSWPCPPQQPLENQTFNCSWDGMKHLGRQAGRHQGKRGRRWRKTIQHEYPKCGINIRVGGKGVLIPSALNVVSQLFTHPGPSKWSNIGLIWDHFCGPPQLGHVARERGIPSSDTYRDPVKRLMFHLV